MEISISCLVLCKNIIYITVARTREKKIATFLQIIFIQIFLKFYREIHVIFHIVYFEGGVETISCS